MWICFNDAFVSAVLDPSDKSDNTIMLRARNKKHLKNLLPNNKILEDVGTDYKYRTFLSKTSFANLLSERIMDLDYFNFKNSVENDRLHELYSKIWYAGMNYQLQNEAWGED